MSSDPKDLPHTPDGLRARVAAYRESLAAPDTNDMFSLAYQWQDKKHRHVTDLCLVIEETAKTIEALEGENERLRKLLFAAGEQCQREADKKDAADARAERLRVALEVIAYNRTAEAHSVFAARALEDDKPIRAAAGEEGK